MISRESRTYRGRFLVSISWKFDTCAGMATNVFVGTLRLDYIDGRNWKVVGGFTFIDEDGEVYTAPDGFVTDFASVPRILWSLLPPTGDYGPAAVIHDFLVRKGVIKRSNADKVFKRALNVLKVSPWKIWVLYKGVCIGTWWNNGKQ